MNNPIPKTIANIAFRTISRLRFTHKRELMLCGTGLAWASDFLEGEMCLLEDGSLRAGFDKGLPLRTYRLSVSLPENRDLIETYLLFLKDGAYRPSFSEEILASLEKTSKERGLEIHEIREGLPMRQDQLYFNFDTFSLRSQKLAYEKLVRFRTAAALLSKPTATAA